MSTSSALASSPLTTSADRQPETPDSRIRSRKSNVDSSSLHMAGEFQPSSSTASPTSTFSDLASRFSDPSRATLRSVATTPQSTPGRRVAIRSDPALITCFDPADKELYDLWAPKM